MYHNILQWSMHKTSNSQQWLYLMSWFRPHSILPRRDGSAHFEANLGFGTVYFVRLSYDTDTISLAFVTSPLRGFPFLCFVLYVGDITCRAMTARVLRGPTARGPGQRASPTRCESSVRNVMAGNFELLVKTPNYDMDLCLDYWLLQHDK